MDSSRTRIESFPRRLFAPLIWRRILTRKRRLHLGLILGKRTHVAFLPKRCELAGNARNTASVAHCRPPVSVSAAGELGEAFEIAPFGDLRRPGREVVA